MESNQELFASEHPRIDNDKHGGLVHPIFPPTESEMLVRQEALGRRRRGQSRLAAAGGQRRATPPVSGDRTSPWTRPTENAQLPLPQVHGAGAGPGRDYVRRTHTTVTWLGTWSYFGSTMRQATTPVHDT
jgi:hypothetical protein